MTLKRLYRNWVEKRQPERREARKLAGKWRKVNSLYAPREARNYVPGPIIVIGFLRAALGIGASARRLVFSLRRAGYKVHAIDCCGQFDMAQHYDWQTDQLPEEPGGTVVFCLNPPELLHYLRICDPKTAAGRKLVGYWFWELERAPESWRHAAAFMDEIWVSSWYVRDSLARRFTETPVRFMPIGLELPHPSPKSRRDFGLADGTFTVLSVFDLRSWVTRKNPIGMVRAFRQAFGSRTDVQYVIKVIGAGALPESLSELAEFIESAPNVKVISDVLSEEDLAALIALSDVVLSLHRSEGLGMVPAEAMALGKPVVMTGWSSTRDFTPYHAAALVGYRLIPVKQGEYLEVPDDCVWADPDISEAAAWLKQIESDPALRRELGIRGQEAVKTYFGWDEVCRQIRHAVSDATVAKDEPAADLATAVGTR